jgi:hypothetical protein
LTENAPVTARPRRPIAGLVTTLALLLTSTILRAGPPASIARKLGEAVLRRAHGPAESGIGKLARGAAKAAGGHADDALTALRRLGPRAAQAAGKEAAEHAPEVTRLVARHGDDALWIVARPRSLALFLRHGDDAARALLTHRAVAEALIERFGTAAVPALNRVTPRNARRLAMLADEPVLARSGRAAEVLGVIGRHGDRALEFVWRHRLVLAGGATLAAFLSHPEPYLDGTARLAGTALDATVRPVAEGVGRAMASRTAPAVGFVALWTAILTAAPILVASTRLLITRAATARVPASWLDTAPCRRHDRGATPAERDIA